MSHQEFFAENVVDSHKVVADFRDAIERIHSSSSQSHGVNKHFSSQSLLQRGVQLLLLLLPGPRVCLLDVSF